MVGHGQSANDETAINANHVSSLIRRWNRIFKCQMLRTGLSRRVTRSGFAEYWALTEEMTAGEFHRVIREGTTPNTLLIRAYLYVAYRRNLTCALLSLSSLESQHLLDDLHLDVRWREGEADSGRNFCPRSVSVSRVQKACESLGVWEFKVPAPIWLIDNNSDHNHDELEGDNITLFMVKIVQSDYLRYLVIKIDA